MAMGGRLGGHLVLGHVDAVGTVLGITQRGHEAFRVKITAFHLMSSGFQRLLRCVAECCRKTLRPRMAMDQQHPHGGDLIQLFLNLRRIRVAIHVMRAWAIGRPFWIIPGEHLAGIEQAQRISFLLEGQLPRINALHAAFFQ